MDFVIPINFVVYKDNFSYIKTMPSFENILLAAGILLLLSAVVSKASDRFGVPALLFFLLIGMLAGSEGIGGSRKSVKSPPPRTRLKVAIRTCHQFCR